MTRKESPGTQATGSAAASHGVCICVVPHRGVERGLVLGLEIRSPLGEGLRADNVRLGLAPAPEDLESQGHQLVDGKEWVRGHELLQQPEELVGVALAVHLGPVQTNEAVVHLVVADHLSKVAHNLAALANRRIVTHGEGELGATVVYDSVLRSTGRVAWCK